MGVNISGSGILSGIASLIVGAVNNLNLLVTRIIGYTTSGGGGSSYYTTMVGSIGLGFVAINREGQIVYSTDGITWSVATDLPGSYYTNLAFGNDKFVTINYTGQTAYSTDGINWSLGTDLPYASGYRDPIFADGKFVVLDYSTGQIACSTDGVTWSLGTGLPAAPYTNIVFGNGKFVLVNSNTGETAYSTGGQFWSFGNQLPGSGYASIDFGNGKFVTIDNTGQTAYSTDGINWSLGTNLSGSGYTNVNFVNDRFISVANYTAQLAYSTDGVNWSLGNQLPGSVIPTFANNKFVGITSGGWTISSTDGVTWLLGTYLSGPGYRNVLFSNDKFVSINHAGQTAYSADGINWSLGTELPGSDYVNNFVIGNISTLVETQISIGDQGSGGAEILAPVDVYTVPANKTTDIDEVRIKNNSGNTITYDLAVLDEGIELTDQNALINDQAVLAGATATVTSITTPMTAGQRIVVFPSAVDVVEVKVYGTETIDQQGVTFQASGIHFADLNGNVYISMNRDGFDSSVLANNGGTNLTIAFDELVEWFYGPELDGFNGQTFTILESGFEDENYGTYIVVDASFSVGAPFGEAFREARSGTIEIFGL